MSLITTYRTPDLWAHFDRYFATAEIRGSGKEALEAICISRWSHRHDWQIIHLELRNLGGKAPRSTPKRQRVERRPKAALPTAKRNPANWLPSEAELDRRLPISARMLAAMGPEIRGVATRHVLAYSLVEDSSNVNSDLIIAITARRYRQLANIGETSPAAILARATDTPVRTIHNRIRIARERDLLPPAGSGRRRLDPLEPTADEMHLVSHLIEPPANQRASRRKPAITRKRVGPRGRASLARVR